MTDAYPRFASIVDCVIDHAHRFPDRPAIVSEDGAVAPVGDQVVGVLGHGRVEVVLDHQHHRSGRGAVGAVIGDRSNTHLVIRSETMHVDVAKLVQFSKELPA